MLLHGTHPLPNGDRVRLRLPHGADRAAMHELLGEMGVATDDLDVRRALRWAPGGRAAICATAWDGTRERLVAFGALDVDEDALTLLGRPDAAPLLREALREQTRAWRRRVA